MMMTMSYREFHFISRLKNKILLIKGRNNKKVFRQKNEFKFGSELRLECYKYIKPGEILGTHGMSTETETRPKGHTQD